MNIGKEILLSIRKNNIVLCEEWTAKMINATTFKALADMYFEGDDWSMENDFPSAEVVKKYKGGIEPYGIKLDASGIYENQRNIAFLGKSKAELNYQGFSVGKVIVRHLSKVKIVASGNAKVFINLLDTAKIDVECLENAKVFIYNYSKSSKYFSSGNNVSIINKSWEMLK